MLFRHFSLARKSTTTLTFQRLFPFVDTLDQHGGTYHMEHLFGMNCHDEWRRPSRIVVVAMEIVILENIVVTVVGEALRIERIGYYS